MERILIKYSNGVTQFFDVITRKFYTEVITPIKDRIYEIECMSSKQFKKNKLELKKLEADLKSHGNFCTDDSPIFDSIETNILSLGKNQGGDHPVNSKFI